MRPDGAADAEASGDRLSARAPLAGGCHETPVRLVAFVPALADQVARVRRAMKRFAAAHAVPPALQADIELAVSEACANVVHHAYREASAPGSMTAEAYRKPGALVIAVTDQGRGMGPRTDSPGAGLGLSLIGRLATSLEIGAPPSMIGTRVQMTFALPDGPRRSTG